MFQFYVRASDQRRVNEGVTLANVTVDIINDQPPVFVNPNNAVITLAETTTPDLVFHTFVANDPDLDVCIYQWWQLHFFHFVSLFDCFFISLDLLHVYFVCLHTNTLYLSILFTL